MSINGRSCQNQSFNFFKALFNKSFYRINAHMALQLLFYDCVGF